MKQINGNLIALALQGEFDVIAHGANTKNVMGAGIALQIADQFPEALDADTECFRMCRNTDTPMIGKMSVAHHLSVRSGKHITILNWYTQIYPGGPCPNDDADIRLKAIATCAKNTVEHFVAMKSFQYKRNVKVGLPLIGCGLAGLDETAVIPILESAFAGTDCTLVRYQP